MLFAIVIVLTLLFLSCIAGALNAESELPGLFPLSRVPHPATPILGPKS